MIRCRTVIRGVCGTVFPIIAQLAAFAAVLFLMLRPGAAFPGVPAFNDLQRGLPPAVQLPIIEIGVCPRDGGPCVYDQPAPYAPPRGHSARWAPPEERPAPYHDAPDEHAHAPPCPRERYARNGYYDAPPPRRDETPPPRRDEYVAYADNSCGVRCWYRRLRAGYCGRGCDYYKFRLTEFPEGKLGPRRRAQLACRTDH